MNSITAMEKEIRYQIDDLPKLDLPNKDNLDKCLIVGAGDSYVAALITEYVSNYRTICCNPMEIVFTPEIIKNRRLYIVSVSGDTKSNILAAKISKKKNIPTTAITARPESKLAKNCDEIIELHYKSTGIPTSGTISFTSSLLCCLSLLGKIKSFDHLNMIYKQAYNEVENMLATTPDTSSCYIFLANGLLFPVAIYGALKINEVFGLKSFAYPFEEFCHSPIFSIKSSDKIMILGDKGYNDDKELNTRLQKLGINSCYVDCARNNSKIQLTERLIKAIMLMQLYVVKKAMREKVKNCFFLENKELLKLSSTFIYHNDGQKREKYMGNNVSTLDKF
jgi:fructoselysine-6-P-deglycase FrlB-like protein